MPKETIRDTAGTYDVRVGWRADSHVQVGIETAAGYSLLTMLYGGREQLARVGASVRSSISHLQLDRVSEVDLGRAILDAIEGSGPADPEHDSYIGVWSTLDRDGCNRLIRTVRRARDAVFGRDE